MKNRFYAYLDSFDEITLIIPNELFNNEDTYKLIGNDEIIDLEIKETTSLGKEEKVVVSFDAYLKLELVYKVVSSSATEAELYDGKIVRTSLFDSIYYYYKKDLGVTYTKSSTKFKIWSPIAKSITIELTDKKKRVYKREMKYKSRGLWRHEELGDIEGFKYRYIVNVNGKELTTLDPYAISSSINNEYNYVINPDKLYKMKYSSNRRSPLKSVIYEASFRDFSINYNGGTYLSFVKEGLKTKNNNKIGFDHLKDLGVTHIQLMPFFAFGGVDESNKSLKYNWGYNPVQYNVPSGYYSESPNDPYSRINELKETIDLIHKAGLNVVMDVVYNHVYNAETFPFEILCPGYAYSYNREGIKTNVSGCQNDVNTSKRMIRKFIEDSIFYLLNEFQIDGFRVDLMGLIDIDTINSLAMELNEIDPNILLYGEGWKMVYTNQADSLSHMYNRAVISSVGFFNDRFRESVKHYASGTSFDEDTLKEVLVGSIRHRFLFKYAHQSINYTECHDDMTAFDALRRINPKLEDDEARKRALLALSMTILSNGIPFIHSGEELFATKNFDSNSYKSGDEVNSIKWDDVDLYQGEINFIKNLIDFRKKSEEFSLDTQTEIQGLVDVTITELKSIIVSYKTLGKLTIVYKTNEDEEAISINKKKQIVLSNLDYTKENDTLKVSGIGVLILKEK